MFIDSNPSEYQHSLYKYFLYFINEQKQKVYIYIYIYRIQVFYLYLFDLI
jgi:hypothetical protein